MKKDPDIDERLDNLSQEDKLGFAIMHSVRDFSNKHDVTRGELMVALIKSCAFFITQDDGVPYEHQLVDIKVLHKALKEIAFSVKESKKPFN